MVGIGVLCRGVSPRFATPRLSLVPFFVGLFFVSWLPLFVREVLLRAPQLPLCLFQIQSRERFVLFHEAALWLLEPAVWAVASCWMLPRRVLTLGAESPRSPRHVPMRFARLPGQLLGTMARILTRTRR